MVSIAEPFDDHAFTWTLGLILSIYVVLSGKEFTTDHYVSRYLIWSLLYVLFLMVHHLDNRLFDKHIKTKVGCPFYEVALYLLTFIIMYEFLQDSIEKTFTSIFLYILLWVSYLYKIVRSIITHTEKYERFDKRRRKKRTMKNFKIDLENLIKKYS